VDCTGRVGNAFIHKHKPRGFTGLGALLGQKEEVSNLKNNQQLSVK
jgi:hypothetical protein